MNLQIKEQKTNALLSRKEVRATLAYEQVTPRREELKKQLATAMKADASKLVIRHIHPIYGERKAELLVFIYDDEASLKTLEPEKKPGKKAAKKKAKAEG